MTRRKFIQKLIKVSLTVIVGTFWLIKKAAPRKFVRAVRLKNYPGSLKRLRNIHKQGKWSG